MKQRITLWFATLLLGIVAMAQPVKKSQEEFEKGYQAFIIQQAQLTEKEAAAFGKLGSAQSVQDGYSRCAQWIPRIQPRCGNAPQCGE